MGKQDIARFELDVSFWGISYIASVTRCEWKWTKWGQAKGITKFAYWVWHIHMISYMKYIKLSIAKQIWKNICLNIYRCVRWYSYGICIHSDTKILVLKCHDALSIKHAINPCNPIVQVVLFSYYFCCVLKLCYQFLINLLDRFIHVRVCFLHYSCPQC